MLDDSAPTWRLVLALAWPVLTQQLLVLVVGLSDQFLAGHFPQVPLADQTQALAHQLLAVGLTRPLEAAPALGLAQEIMARQVAYQSAQNTAIYLTWFISSYMVLVGVGSTALVSRLIGAGDADRAIHATHQALVLAVGMGLLGTLIGLTCLEPLVRLLGLRGHAATYAVAYLRPLFWLLVFQMVAHAGIACLTGAGDTRTGLWVLGGVALVNVPLSWVCFHGPTTVPGWTWLPLPQDMPGLGFAGIAWGTALSQALGAGAVLLILAGGRAGLIVRLRGLWPDPAMLHRLLRISVPAGIDSISTALGQLWYLSIVNDLGDVASTAHGIALRWEGLGYMSGGAFGAAAMTLVGQHLGAGRPDRAAHSVWVAFLLGCGVMCAMAAVFYVLAPEMFLVFCPLPEQRPVIDVGVPVLRLVAFAMPSLACCIVFTSALRGAGDTAMPVLYTWIGFLAVRIPLAYLLTRPDLEWAGLGHWEVGQRLYGAWVAMFADLFLRGVLLYLRFAGGRWKALRV